MNCLKYVSTHLTRRHSNSVTLQIVYAEHILEGHQSKHQLKHYYVDNHRKVQLCGSTSSSSVKIL